MDFVRAYLDAGRPADAMAWLHDPWGHLESSWQGLLAETLERLGQFDESLPLRQTIFVHSLAVFHLRPGGMLSQLKKSGATHLLQHPMYRSYGLPLSHASETRSRDMFAPQ
jgi:hypothetical protein